VKHFRGRIAKIETIREKHESFLELTCHDNLHYLQTSINENWPDRVSYAMFDYNGIATSPFHPNGKDYPVAWDGFLLSEAVQDICVKSNIDPTYLYKRDVFITSGLTYIKASRKLQGENIRLTKPSQYGNAFFAGPGDDPEADDEYLWKQGYGEPMIDMVSNFADNYGFLFTCSVDGDVTFRTRDTPQFALASDPRWVLGAGWSRVVDKRALGGSYLYGNGATPIRHSKITVSGSRFDLHMALDPNSSLDFHHIQNHEGFSPTGWAGAPYEFSDVVTWDHSPAWASFFGVRNSLIFLSTPNHPDVLVNLYKGNKTFVQFKPQDAFNITSIDIVLQNGSKYTRPGGVTTYKVDVYIGEQNSTFSATDHYGNDTDNAGYPAFLSGSTQIVNGFDVTGAFSFTSPQHIRIPTTSFAVITSKTYLLKFTTRLFQDGVEMTLRNQLDLIDTNQFWFQLFTGALPIWTATVRPIGLRISYGANPDPTALRYMHESLSLPLSTYTAYNDNFTTPLWLDAETNPGGEMKNTVENNYFIQLSLHDDPAQGEADRFGVTVTNASNTVIFDQKFPNNLTSSIQDIRFSTEGIDLMFGRNPCIFPIRAETFEGSVIGTNLSPDMVRYTVHVSGLNCRIEALAEYYRDPHSYKMRFDTASNLYSLGTVQDTANIRNDVVVVGRAKGSVLDPNTSQVINPNNPTFDYVFSRAMDAGSISDHLADNSLGKNETFVIFEPGIATQEHADWLSKAVLDRYRKIQNQVDMNGLAIPYLDIEDSVTVGDAGLWTNNHTDRHWIEEIEEDISSSTYNGTLTLTPLPPWPSFIPTPPPDIHDFEDVDGNPNLILDIKLIDDNNLPRWTGAVLPSTNYDPYESEGASVVNNLGKEVKLKLSYRLLVAGELNIQIRDFTTNQIITYLVGGGTEDGTHLLFERRGIGVYDEPWDSIDFQGGSRRFDSTQQIADQELNETTGSSTDGYKGIYAKGDGAGSIWSADGRYYVVFEFNAFEDSYHDPPNGALRVYNSKYLATLANNGKVLNDVAYGKALTGITDRHEAYWKLSLGEKTKIHLLTSPAIGAHPEGGPRSGVGGNNQLLFFRSDDNASTGNPGLHVFVKVDQSLTGTTKSAHSNRQIKTRVDVDSAFFGYAPFEESTFDEDNDHIGVTATSPNGHQLIYPDQNDTVEVFDRFASNGTGEILEFGAVAVADGVTAGVGGFCQAVLHDDQYHYNMIVGIQNNRATSVEGIGLEDKFRRLEDMTIVINPRGSRIGHVYNQIPIGYGQNLHDSILSVAKVAYGGSPCNQGEIHTYGYRVKNLVFAARWYTIIYDAWDRSGRAPLITNLTYNHKQGIGKVSATQGWGNYNGLTVIRAHWVPVASDSVSFNGALLPDYTYLNAADNTRYAFQRYTDPNWSGVTDPTGGSGPTSIVNHPVVCVCGDTRPNDLFGDVPIPQRNAFDFMTTTQFNDFVSKYAFYAWPIHHFWKASSMGNNKANWTKEGHGAADFTGSLQENTRG
jgi:hypothetical protein